MNEFDKFFMNEISSQLNKYQQIEEIKDSECFLTCCSVIFGICIIKFK